MISGHVLVIDDEFTIRSTLTRILHHAGCEVTSAANGHEAFRILAEISCDLVFLDIRLPEMDGLDVLREIRSGHPQLPVIILTGYGSMQSALDAIHLGATDYLLKPIDPSSLLLRVESILKEQTIQHRRQEIQKQIVALQEELRLIDTRYPTLTPQITSVDIKNDRFFQLGVLTLDLEKKRVLYKKEQISLPPATFEYLAVLARHSPEIVSYQTLAVEALGYQTTLNDARILSKWHIYNLRKTLSTETGMDILNVRGKGYRLLVD